MKKTLVTQFLLWIVVFSCLAFTHAKADDITRISKYVTTRDGTQLALDIYFPVDVSEQHPAPVILTMTPYQRARKGPNGLVTPDASTEYLVKQGFIVAIGDVRGKGASFGSRRAPSDQTEIHDVQDMIDWLAVQPWSTGSIGMQGCSYVGSTVMAGLRSGTPALKAAVVGSTQWDMMTSFTRGGELRTRKLADEVAGIDADIARAVPVDEDIDGSMLQATRSDKSKNWLVSEIWGSLPFRDSVSSITGDQYWMTSSTYADRQNIEKNNTPIFMYGSWYDLFSNETNNMWLSLNNPKMLLWSRGAHCRAPNIDRDAMVARFFDRYLNGNQNNIDKEPRVTYYVENGVEGHEWQTASDWPLPADLKRFYLGVNAGQGTLGEALQDAGELSVTPPDNILPMTNFSFERANVDPLSVTFTSLPLPEETIIAGTPIINVVLSAPLDDYVVNAFLERVNRFQSPYVISRNRLLASRRQLGEAPYETAGVPYQSQLEADKLPVGVNNPITLQFGLSPIVVRLNAGDQLRLALTLRVSGTDPVVPLSVYFADVHSSWIDIPFMKN